MSGIDLLIAALASWRLAYMLTHEDGPWQIFTRLRTRWPLGGLLTCLYCLNVWAALLCYGLLHSEAAVVVYVLAASGGALMLWRYTGGGHVQ